MEALKATAELSGSFKARLHKYYKNAHRLTQSSDLMNERFGVKRKAGKKKTTIAQRERRNRAVWSHGNQIIIFNYFRRFLLDSYLKRVL